MLAACILMAYITNNYKGGLIYRLTTILAVLGLTCLCLFPLLCPTPSIIDYFNDMTCNSHIAVSNSEIVVLGDFNYHYVLKEIPITMILFSLLLSIVVLAIHLPNA